MTTKKKTSGKKSFDCLAYKASVQARVQAEIAGMSPEEEIAYFDRAVKAGPFAELWARLGENERAA